VTNSIFAIRVLLSFTLNKIALDFQIVKVLFLPCPLLNSKYGEGGKHAKKVPSPRVERGFRGEVNTPYISR